MERAMTLLHEDPDFLVEVMRRIEGLTIAFCMAQIEAGANMMFMGDSAASQVSPRFYEQYIRESETRVVRAVQETGVPVRLHICGDITRILEPVAQTGARFIDVDYPVDLTEACRRVADVNTDAYVVGNFDPVKVLLRGTPDEIRAACEQCEARTADFENFILAPGCEVPPATPVENYQALVEFGWKMKDGRQ
jgi:MtaA/CmuA family methyltransferase